MADIFKGELQDHKGNTVYNHSEADVIFCTDGETVQDKLNRTENTLGNASGKSGSLEVNDDSILATTKATHELAENQGGCKLSYENGEFYVQAGADTASKKKLGSGGKIYKLGNGFSFDITDIVGAENVGKYDINNFLVVWNPPSGSSTLMDRGTSNTDVSKSVVSVSNSGAYSKSYVDGVITISGGTVTVGNKLTVSYSNGDNHTPLNTSFNITVTPTVYFIDGAEILSVS